MNALVGPATSGATAETAVANAGKAGVPLVTPSATQDDLTKVKNTSSVQPSSIASQGKIIAKYTRIT